MTQYYYCTLEESIVTLEEIRAEYEKARPDLEEDMSFSEYVDMLTDPYNEALYAITPEPPTIKDPAAAAFLDRVLSAGPEEFAALHEIYDCTPFSYGTELAARLALREYLAAKEDNSAAMLTSSARAYFTAELLRIREKIDMYADLLTKAEKAGNAELATRREYRLAACREVQHELHQVLYHVYGVAPRYEEGPVPRYEFDRIS